MRGTLFISGIFVATAMLSGGARAQSYPWCAQYGAGMGGAVNCGFTSFQQCQADVSGIGGFCEPNTTYQRPAGPHRQHRAQP